MHWIQRSGVHNSWVPTRLKHLSSIPNISKYLIIVNFGNIICMNYIFGKKPLIFRVFLMWFSNNNNKLRIFIFQSICKCKCVCSTKKTVILMYSRGQTATSVRFKIEADENLSENDYLWCISIGKIECIFFLPLTMRAYITNISYILDSLEHF